METSAYDTLAAARLKVEWGDALVLEMLLDFIDTQCEQEPFSHFVEDRVSLERELEGGC